MKARRAKEARLAEVVEEGWALYGDPNWWRRPAFWQAEYYPGWALTPTQTARVEAALAAYPSRAVDPARTWWSASPDAWLDYGRYDSTTELMALANIYDGLSVEPEELNHRGTEASEKGIFEIKWIEVAHDIKRAVKEERDARGDLTLRQVEAWQFYREGVRQAAARKLESGLLTRMVT